MIRLLPVAMGFGKGFIGGATVLLMPSVIYDRYQIIKNKKIEDPTEKGIVLIAKESDISSVGHQFFCSRGKIAKFFTEKNIILDWKYRAESNDLKQILNDPTYQSITLVGHSERSKWSASDKDVELSNISEMWDGKQKNGYWLQWGCGDPIGKPLGYDVMMHKDRILGWKSKLNVKTRHNLEVLDYGIEIIK